MKNSTKENLAFIKEHINSAGRLVDYYGEINVKTAEDIKLFVTDKHVTIEFGEMLLKWTKDDFLDQEVITALQEIGIECRIDPETEKLLIYYKGELVERWVS